MARQHIAHRKCCFEIGKLVTFFEKNSQSMAEILFGKLQYLNKTKEKDRNFDSLRACATKKRVQNN